MTNPHRLFPLGMHCCHCEQWNPIAYVAKHVNLVHPDCRSCGLELMLAESLFEEAEEALDIARSSSAGSDSRRVVYSEG